MNSKLKGVFIPVVTPFTAQKVDLGKLTHNIRKWNETPVAGYMPLGSNGEFSHMDDEEQLSVLKAVMESKAPEKVIMAGIARQSAYSTVEFGKKAQDMGVDFVSVLCPSYYASFMKDEALIRYYTAVADALEVPVLLYNCPKFAANVTISTDVVRVLSQHPNIAGMKDTSSGNIEKYLEVKDESFDVVAGSISNYLTGLLSGASGGVLSLANYLPGPCCGIQPLFEAGRIEEVKQLSDKLAALSKNATDKYGIAGVKAGCDMFGYMGGEVRNPLADCTPEQKEMIRQAFIESGYLKA
jgi:4-hydroxy-2-oxoglutarate aldolase